MWIFWWRRKNPPATNAWDFLIALIERARKKESTKGISELAKEVGSKLGPGDRMKVTPDSVEVEKGERALPTTPGTGNMPIIGPTSQSSEQRRELPRGEEPPATTTGDALK
jgi:hypothetical protein